MTAEYQLAWLEHLYGFYSMTVWITMQKGDGESCLISKLMFNPFVSHNDIEYYFLNKCKMMLCFDIWLPRQLILYIILPMAMKLHAYGTRSTMYMYVWSK